jgi:hypothetical protein
LESAQARAGGEDPQALLQDNPYAFSPRQDRMAQFHALLSRDLGRPPSRFYAHALAYFSGRPGWDQWSFVGYQGIADVACRHPDEPLSTAIDKLPAKPLVALAHCLESQRFSQRLRDALLRRLDRELDTAHPDAAIVAALIRAVSRHATEADVRERLRRLLDHPCGKHIEWLAAIAGRAWEALDDRELLERYLERLADNDHGQAAFEHCVGDLLSLPAQAGQIRQALRSPEMPAQLRAAFARMSGDAKADP